MKSTEQFIEESQKLHPGKYTYFNTIYTGCVKKVTITCPLHGDFQVTPNAHLSTQRSGCQKCAGRYHYNTEEFISEAEKIHRGKYNYDAASYVNNKTKVTVHCPIHGAFRVTPRDHVHNRCGCPRCSNATKGSYHKKDTTWFADRGREVHGEKYDYNKVVYQGYHLKVEIVCPEHGSFFQTAGSHIHNKSGCPTCSYKDYEGGYGRKRLDNHPELKDKAALLYVIRLHKDGEVFIKIGITQKTVQERFNVNNRLPYEYEELHVERGKLYDLFTKEQQAKKYFKQHKYVPSIKFNGHSECFCEELTPVLLTHLKVVA